MTTKLNYNELKHKYETFKENMPEDKFSKCYNELQYVKAIISAIKRENITEDLDKYMAIKKENLEELHAMGYKNIK